MLEEVAGLREVGDADVTGEVPGAASPRTLFLERGGEGLRQSGMNPRPTSHALTQGSVERLRA